jgi:hypothetical protein
MSRSLTLFSIGLALALAAAAAPAAAQDAAANRQKFKLEVPAQAAQEPGDVVAMLRGAPGTSTATPLAFIPAMGDAFISGGYQMHKRSMKQANGAWGADGKNDGSLSLGFGLGDASDVVGLEVVATTVSPFRVGLGRRSTISVQVAHLIDPTFAVAVGVENAVLSGLEGEDGTQSFYGVASKVFRHPFAGASWLGAITVSGGLGNGRFRMVDDFNANNGTVNAFGSLALLVHDQVSLVTDYTGQDLNVGVSVVPYKKIPLVITPALVDLTGTASRTARFVLGAGLGLHF